MQWPGRFLAHLAVGWMVTGSDASESWSFSSKGADFRAAVGQAKIEGPLEIHTGPWRITASRQALLVGKNTLRKKAGIRGYQLKNRWTAGTFLGTSALEHSTMGTLITASFLQWNIATGSVASRGPGIVTRTGGKAYRSTSPDSAVEVDLVTASMTRSGPGWQRLVEGSGP